MYYTAAATHWHGLNVSDFGNPSFRPAIYTWRLNHYYYHRSCIEWVLLIHIRVFRRRSNLIYHEVMMKARPVPVWRLTQVKWTCFWQYLTISQQNSITFIHIAIELKFLFKGTYWLCDTNIWLCMVLLMVKCLIFGHLIMICDYLHLFLINA